MHLAVRHLLIAGCPPGGRASAGFGRGDRAIFDPPQLVAFGLNGLSPRFQRPRSVRPPFLNSNCTGTLAAFLPFLLQMRMNVRTEECRRRAICLVIIGIVVLILIEAQSVAKERLPIVHGTFFSLIRSDDFIAVSIDSRTVNDRTGIRDDTVCKIVPLNKRLFFFSVGFSGHEDQRTRNIVHQTYVQVQQSPNLFIDLPEAFLARIFNVVTPLFRPLLPGETAPPIIQGYFAGADSGNNLQVVEIEVDRGLMGAVKLPIKFRTDQTFHALVRRAISEEFVDKPNERVLALKRDIAAQFGASSAPEQAAASVAATVQAIINSGSSKFIGGAAAAVILERGQDFRWYIPGACQNK